MVDGGKVILAQVAPDQQAKHGGRRTEGGDIVLCEHGKDFLFVKAVKVVDKYGTLAQPLTVELAPQGLAPAGIGDGEMQAIPLATVPIFCGDIVPQSVGVLVGSHLRIAGGAGGEEHQGGIVTAAGILRTDKFSGEVFELLVEVVPALPMSIHKNLMLDLRTVGGGSLSNLGGIAICGAEQSGNACCIEAVLKVMLLQLVGGGNGNSTDFMQGNHSKPELVVPLQNQHYLVSPLDAQRGQIVGCLVGIMLDLPEGKPSLLFIPIHMEHGQLIGVFLGDLIHDIKAEVEMLGVFEPDILQSPVFVLLTVHKFLADQTANLLGGDHTSADGFLPGGLSGKDNGHKNAVFAIHSHHAVRRGGIIIDTVTFLQILHMAANLNLQAAADNQVEFLTGVGVQMQGLSGQRRVILITNPVGLRNLVPEFRSQIGDVNAVFLRGFLTAALPGYGVAAQSGRPAFQQLHHFHIESQGAFMNKAEGNVHTAPFVNQVILYGNFGLERHFRF